LPTACAPIGAHHLGFKLSRASKAAEHELFGVIATLIRAPPILQHSVLRRQASKMKYILVTGGVISGVGKGVITSSFGTILKNCGIHVTSIKIDPYINIDAGTFSPYEHGMNDNSMSICYFPPFDLTRRTAAFFLFSFMKLFWQKTRIATNALPKMEDINFHFPVLFLCRKFIFFLWNFL